MSLALSQTEMDMSSNDNARFAKALAAKFVERADLLGYKGKKRDDASLDFWTGAAALAEIEGNTELYELLGRQAALIVAVRGYFGVKQIAEG